MSRSGAAQRACVAYLIPRAGCIYEIIEWNFGRDALAEAFLAGLAPAAKSGPVPRTP